MSTMQPRIPCLHSMHCGGWGVKPPIHFHCLLYISIAYYMQITCEIAYVLNGRPLGTVYVLADTSG